MPDALGPWAANIGVVAILDRPGLYLALHTLDPTGGGSTEVIGGDYSRQPISFAFGGRAAVSNIDAVFQGLLPVTVNYLAVWNAVAAGLLVLVKDITATPLVTSAEGLIYVNQGDLALAL